MKIYGKWLDAPSTQTVFDVLQKAGHQVFSVGGCVRNTILGFPVEDVDIATDARPENVLELAHSAGLKAVATGIDHGTVTVISNHIAYEITTFRKDVETYGRHATVAYATDISDDARRRDFTMNALYAHSDGTVIDPLQGLDDLLARQVRFIENANQRIREDYLRILRFFRFHAWYGDPEKGLDSEGLAAVAANVEGLDGLSRERVGAELIKLLSAADPAPSVAALRTTGILHRILPASDDQYLAQLIHLEDMTGTVPNSMRRLACLGGSQPKEYLRLSNAETRQLELLNQGQSLPGRAAELGYRYGKKTGMDIVLLRAALLGQSLNHHIHDELAKGSKAIFPIRARDLMPDYKGPALGAKLCELEKRWIASDFTLNKQSLL